MKAQELLERQHTTWKFLQQLLKEPGQVSIRINKMNGYWIPFVFYEAPNEDAKGYGPLAEGENVIGAEDLGDLMESLRKTLGHDVKIYAPQTPPPKQVLH